MLLVEWGECAAVVVRPAGTPELVERGRVVGKWAEASQGALGVAGLLVGGEEVVLSGVVVALGERLNVAGLGRVD